VPLANRLEHTSLGLLPETLEDLRKFSLRTKVPMTVVLRDAIDVFVVLLRGCNDYPHWQERLRKAIADGLEGT
jgi:hypothetical protein